MLYDCFADEIAVDFPSVGTVVERMRDSLLGGHDEDDVLHAEVLVSSREAGGGLIVPIEVPIRGTCPQCGGRGETWTERCDSCRGSGETLLRQRLRVSVPPGVVDGARFNFSVSLPHARARTGRSPRCHPIFGHMRIAIGYAGNRARG